MQIPSTRPHLRYLPTRSQQASDFAVRCGITEFLDSLDEVDPPTYDIDFLLTLDPYDEEMAEAVEREVRRLKAIEAARHKVRQQSFSAPPRVVTLDQRLNEPDLEVEFTLRDLHPRGGNALIFAEAKVGKTTLALNLLRSLADGVPFLDHFESRCDEGRIAYLNYEVSAATFALWCRELGIRRPERVLPLDLRGVDNPFNSDAGTEWLTAELRRHEARVVILDPLNAAKPTEASENSNDEMGAFTALLDRVKRDAGVKDLFVVHHKGHGNADGGSSTHGRGASKLKDWPDALWDYRKLAGPNDPRILSVEGRDVALHDALIEYDRPTRELTLALDRDVHTERREAKLRKSREVENAVLAWLRDNPGANSTAIRRAGLGKTEVISQAQAQLIDAGRIRVEQRGPARLHYVVEAES